MSTITVRINENEEKFFKEYSKFNKKPISSLLKEALIEKIEDEFDYKLYEEAIKDFTKNPKTYTHEEIKKKLNIPEST